MSIDFATISPLGASILVFLVCAALVAIAILSKVLHNVKIETKNLKVESQDAINKAVELETKMGTVNSDYCSKSREVIKKQSNLAKHHILNLAGDLRTLFANKYDMTTEEKATTWVLVSLFVSELKSQVFNNFTENHIGNNQYEIEGYTRLRTREYMAFAESFFDDYDWVIPRFRLKEAIKELPEAFFYERLLIIYRDGKEMEKQTEER